MPDGLLLAFDFGLRRIGIATGNGLTRTASPLTTLAANGRPPWSAIDAIVREWEPELLVVGRPGPATNDALLTALDDFVATLENRYGIDVVSVDESFTSTAAADALRSERRLGLANRRVHREQIDQRAACLIAEQWMNRPLD